MDCSGCNLVLLFFLTLSIKKLRFTYNPSKLSNNIRIKFIFKAWLGFLFKPPKETCHAHRMRRMHYVSVMVLQPECDRHWEWTHKYWDGFRMRMRWMKRLARTPVVCPSVRSVISFCKLAENKQPRVGQAGTLHPSKRGCKADTQIHVLHLLLRIEQKPIAPPD